MFVKPICISNANAITEIDSVALLARHAYSHPIHHTHLPVEYLNANDYYELLIKKSILAVQESKKLNIQNRDLLLSYLASFSHDHFAFDLHLRTFIPSLKAMATDEQQLKYLPLGESCQIVAAYAQTELGHGSDLQMLETEAVYDQESDSFILNTPTITSTKFWPGLLGRTANYALLMAQLYSPTREDYCGLHAFVVQIRDLETHEPLPGIELGEISAPLKNVSDNGYMCLTNVRIPRNQMLMRLSKVDENGNFQRVGDPRLLYSSMLSLRVYLSSAFSMQLAKATTIATRYSAVRLQGRNDEGKEILIIDYPLQQNKIFPSIATSYAFIFTFKKLQQTYNNMISSEQEEMLKQLPEIHSLSAGLKAYIATHCERLSQMCRFACGGHGCLIPSGLIGIKLTLDEACTVEGENSVMLQQTARYLMKVIQNGDDYSKSPSITYLKIINSEFKQLNGLQDYCKLFEIRAERLIRTMYAELASSSSSSYETFIRNSTQLVHMAEAHLETFVLRSFYNSIKNITGNKVVSAVLEQLFELFAIYRLKMNTFDFLQFDILSKEKINFLINKRLNELYCLIRPNAVSLVDAFDFHDNELNSVIGQYDGHVYEALMKQSRLNPSNKTKKKEKRRQRLAIINRVRNHLYQEDLFRAIVDDDDGDDSNNITTSWLPNSNKIGIGYNPLYGSPVCYTGICHSEGFRRSIFDLTFKQPTEGTCTNKLIPENVELDCVPSSDIVATTESVGTLSELSKSTSDGISFGVDFQYGAFSAGYGHSKETTFMIDNIIKKDTTAMHTIAKVTYAKLSMFEPFMELSDTFRYVIDEMPCCDYDDAIEKYLHEFVIDYFGFTFITEIVLGGIAQEILFIDNAERRQMEQNGHSVSNSASIGFFITMKMETSASQNQTQTDEFKKSIKTSRSTKLGGDPSLQSIYDWKKSVPSSPIVMHLTVGNIVNLLSENRFPNDSLIHNKSQLLNMAIQRYLQPNSAFCYNNCTDINHGQCDTSGYFLFGNCKCNPSWSGLDCSQKGKTCKQKNATSCMKPSWATHGANNTMYIADQSNHRILKWKHGNGEIGQVVAGETTMSGTNATQLYNPAAVALDKNESLYVLDLYNGRVQKFMKGSSQGITVASGFSTSAGMHVDSDGNVYIVDSSSHSVTKHVAGVSIIVAGGNGIGNDSNQLNNPISVFVDQCKNIYIIDQGNYRIQQWSNDAKWGIPIFTWTAGVYNFHHMIGDDYGNIYLTDSYSVYKWAPDAPYLTRIAGTGTIGSDAQHLYLPYGLAFDPDGNLFVSDTYNYRVQLFTLDS
ncbi:unnamed protein product, partial [Didymodactylos carnosus]